MKELVFAAALAVLVAADAQEDVVVKVSQMSNLLNLPVVVTSGDLKEVKSVKAPSVPVGSTVCKALCVSHFLVEMETGRLVGAMGSNVYPTVAEGAYAMTNEILRAVCAVAGDRGIGTPPRKNAEGNCMEMFYWWRPTAAANGELELVVRSYVNESRQMAVCTCLHTKGDGIKSGMCF